MGRRLLLFVAPLGLFTLALHATAACTSLSNDAPLDDAGDASFAPSADAASDGTAADGAIGDAAAMTDSDASDAGSGH